MCQCFVPDCNHLSERETCKFFRFPSIIKAKAVRAKWITLIRRRDREPNKQSRVCSCHFVDGKKENHPEIFAWNIEKLMKLFPREVATPAKCRKIKTGDSTPIDSTISQSISTFSYKEEPEDTDTDLPPPYVDMDKAMSPRLSGFSEGLFHDFHEIKVEQEEESVPFPEIKVEQEEESVHFSEIELEQEEESVPFPEIKVEQEEESVPFPEIKVEQKEESVTQRAVLDKLNSTFVHSECMSAPSETYDGTNSEKAPQTLAPSMKQGSSSTEFKQEINNELVNFMDKASVFVKKEMGQITSDNCDCFSSPSIIYDMKTESIPTTQGHTEVDTEFICGQTNAKSSHTREFEKHSQSHVKERSFACNLCDAGRTQCDHVKGHKRIHKGIHKGEKRFSCDACDARFSERKYLLMHTRTHLFSAKYHTRIHTGEKVFACDECGARFSRKAYMKKHKLVHTKEKLFSSDECIARFSTTTHMKKHRCIHTEELPFSCDECNAKFSVKASLTKHSFIHPKTMPLSCEVCNATFWDKTGLKKHIGSHSEEKPFACTVCGAGFLQSKYLERHKPIHTSRRIKLVTCEVCNSRFWGMTDLRRHLYIHIEDKPFACAICGARFSHIGYLKNHSRCHTRKKLFYVQYAMPVMLVSRIRHT